ncbi:MAG TPA: hypothetical protein VKY81_03360 [Natronosporangium sp.]|nr:hypothetical protein [Natronosporangium sp.]
MYETTRGYGTRPARWNRWWLAAVAAPVTLLVSLAGCALTGRSAPDIEPPADEVPAATASAPADDVDTADGSRASGGGEAGDRGGSGSSGSSGGTDTGGGTGPAPGDTGEPPYIRDLYHDAYIEPDNSGTTQVTAMIDGHAFDPAGPDEQERVARVDIDWGDGSVSSASLGGHGAFGAQHIYPMTYAGQTVAVRVVAYGHDGRTAVRSLELALPTM